MALDLIYRGPALRFYAVEASPAERERLETCFGHLRVNPYLDLITKYKLNVGSDTFNLHNDGGFIIGYRFLNNTTIEVLSIARAPDVPPHTDPRWRL